MDIFLSINQLPTAIKYQLISRLLSSDTFNDVTDWLNGEFYRAIIAPSYQALSKWHGVENLTPEAHYFGLYLGFPFSEVIALRRQIEALGLDHVRQQLLAKLIEKNGSMFVYLDDKEGK